MEISYEMLLYPELLENSQIIQIIRERQLKIDNLETMVRDELLELFNNYCVPYSQRKYKDNYRGRLLNKNRCVTTESEPDAINVNNINYKLLKQSNDIDRLKPTPDIYAAQPKRFKLDALAKVVNNDYSFKRKIPLDDGLNGQSPTKKHRKVIAWP